METFFVLLGLLVLAFPIIAIVALVKAIGLGDQLRRVDMQLAALERRVAQSSPGAAAPPLEPTAHVPESAPSLPHHLLQKRRCCRSTSRPSPPPRRLRRRRQRHQPRRPHPP
jgi:hypothetical protein